MSIIQNIGVEQSADNYRNNDQFIFDLRYIDSGGQIPTVDRYNLPHVAQQHTQLCQPLINKAHHESQ